MACQKYCSQSVKFFCKKCQCQICKDLLPRCKCNRFDFPDIEFGWIEI